MVRAEVGMRLAAGTGLHAAAAGTGPHAAADGTDHRAAAAAGTDRRAAAAAAAGMDRRAAVDGTGRRVAAAGTDHPLAMAHPDAGTTGQGTVVLGRVAREATTALVLVAALGVLVAVHPPVGPDPTGEGVAVGGVHTRVGAVIRAGARAARLPHMVAVRLPMDTVCVRRGSCLGVRARRGAKGEGSCPLPLPALACCFLPAQPARGATAARLLRHGPHEPLCLAMSSMPCTRASSHSLQTALDLFGGVEQVVLRWGTDRMVGLPAGGVTGEQVKEVSALLQDTAPSCGAVGLSVCVAAALIGDVGKWAIARADTAHAYDGRIVCGPRAGRQRRGAWRCMGPPRRR